jgi:hypothetical protein
MKKDFSFYEFTGVIVPGATLVLGIALQSAKLRLLFIGESFGVGQLGLFVVVAYVAGHLIQSVGNQLERLLWLRRGMPSTWIRRAKPPYLSDSQRAALQDALPTLMGQKVPPLVELDLRACRGITGQLYARLQQAQRVQRVDIFNANYGLFRGIASALLVVAIVAAINHGIATAEFLVIAIAFVLALLRMHRFGVHYASELYRQALVLASEKSTPPQP